MKPGDLVKVNRPWGTSRYIGIGIVVGRKRRYEAGRAPLVIVLLSGIYKLLDYYDLEVISEAR